nr:MAG TPA: hypothetical protein [Bacteriophage sp.]
MLNFIKSNNLKVISHKKNVRTEQECHSNAIIISATVIILSPLQGSPYRRTSSRKLCCQILVVPFSFFR